MIIQTATVAQFSFPAPITGVFDRQHHRPSRPLTLVRGPAVAPTGPHKRACQLVTKRRSDDRFLQVSVLILTACPGVTGAVQYIRMRDMAWVDCSLGLSSSFLFSWPSCGTEARNTCPSHCQSRSDMADQDAGAELYASSSKKGVMRELRENPYVLGLASVSFSVILPYFFPTLTTC